MKINNKELTKLIMEQIKLKEQASLAPSISAPSGGTAATNTAAATIKQLSSTQSADIQKIATEAVTKFPNDAKQLKLALEKILVNFK